MPGAVHEAHMSPENVLDASGGVREGVSVGRAPRGVHGVAGGGGGCLLLLSFGLAGPRLVDFGIGVPQLDFAMTSRESDKHSDCFCYRHY